MQQIIFISAITIIDTTGETLRCELAPLNAISDHNPKYLLTMDNTHLTSHNGIKQIHALDWLWEIAAKRNKAY